MMKSGIILSNRMINRSLNKITESLMQSGNFWSDFKNRRPLIPILLILSGGSSAFPAEGMWTFDNLPAAALQEKYGFMPAPEWLEHVRLAFLRPGGGAGSF